MLMIVGWAFCLEDTDSLLRSQSRTTKHPPSEIISTFIPNCLWFYVFSFFFFLKKMFLYRFLDTSGLKLFQRLNTFLFLLFLPSDVIDVSCSIFSPSLKEFIKRFKAAGRESADSCEQQSGEKFLLCIQTAGGKLLVYYSGWKCCICVDVFVQVWIPVKLSRTWRAAVWLST